jgi:hypothetical protein
LDLGYLPHERVRLGFLEQKMTNFQWYELGILLSEIGLVLMGAGLMLVVLLTALCAYFCYAEKE